MAGWHVVEKSQNISCHFVTSEFLVTEFGLRAKKKMELNKEHFTEKLRKHRN
jgi:hypothetical protein